ncbi:PhoP/PhoQ regulator MgrB [Ewingella sp. 20WA0182]|uniref:PhoP/PhoQ regulator MgrB n=1 Tax=Ewingella allii TaxID=3092550 RepID=UPI001829BF91|nr:PhoP/PhoQ regulator MgrB [Pseudomonas reactans]
MLTLSSDKPDTNRKKPTIKPKRSFFNLKKLSLILVLLVICIALYLLALNSYCDQGGNFELGVCAVTSFIPW